MAVSEGASSRMRLKRTLNLGVWVAQPVKCLPLAQVLIQGPTLQGACFSVCPCLHLYLFAHELIKKKIITIKEDFKPNKPEFTGNLQVDCWYRRAM